MAFPTAVNNQITDAVAPAGATKKKSRGKTANAKSAKKTKPAKKTSKNRRRKK